MALVRSDRGLAPAQFGVRAVIISRLIASAVLALALSACVYVPRTTTIYDKDCDIEAKHMTMELTQIGGLAHCQGSQCAQLLVAAGAVTAASAVVSGSIVVTGNVVYWFEKQGRCLLSPVTSPPQRAPSG